ncbi:MAG: DUF4173 domain-containing protein [Actinomycetota bacterium]|nr:DUF4173 domain-containing protein [Actinomycetota bacterium]
MTATAHEPTDAVRLPAGWPDVLDVDPADRRVLGAVVVAAVATDLALRSGLAGIAGVLLFFVVTGGLLASGRVVNRRAWPLLLAAPGFGMWLVGRDAEWLLGLDVLAAGGLLVLGASLARRGDPLNQSIPDVLGRALHAFVHGVLAAGFALGALRRGDTRSSAPVAVARGILLAGPIVVAIGLLLGSADPVFASFFRLPTDFGDLLVHLIFLGIGGWGASGLLRMASAAPYGLRPSERRPLGALEAATILGGLVAVFSAFAVSQVVTVLGGDSYVRRTSGLSYADHARSGFFQLLAVAALTLGVLLVVRATVEHHDRRFVVLSEAAVLLTLVVVVGALRRLALYEQAYGLTVLRLWSVVFALWIGAVFVLFGLSVAGWHRLRSWFVPATMALGLAGLFVLNVVNPEAVIVARNVDRFAGTDRLDVPSLVGLSDDAVPTLFDRLDRLSPSQRVEVLERLCNGRRGGEGGVWSFNASRDAAVEARNQGCG